MKKMSVLLSSVLLSAVVCGDVSGHRPETWFHVIGGNASKAGLTADLQAIKAAGYSGIQFFHGALRGALGTDEIWEVTKEPIPCLSPNWDDLVRHAADECARLGLTFRMQNCPGWSMSGGPWIDPAHAMRKLVYARQDVEGGNVPEINVPEIYVDADSDWHDVCMLAFPVPEGDSGVPLKTSGLTRDGNVWKVVFENPETIRTIELPSPRGIGAPNCYTPKTRPKLEAVMEKGAVIVCEVDYPQGNWQDTVPFTLACDEMSSKEWRLTFSASYEVKLPFVRFYSAARQDNWEGESATTLRGLLKRPAPKQDAKAYVAAGSVREVKPGDALPAGKWTVLRIGHVNMKLVNAPAPANATGWECDKLDPRGIEANFAAYIGRVAKGPAQGKLKGMIVDSWECERQTWTWDMERYFREANGYEVRKSLPALFGWVVGSPAETQKFHLDWRRTVGDLVTKNYYGRMSELAHAAGLDVAYETALGDVAVGDILEYWKYCDTPMCEFWWPYNPAGGVGHPNFKPAKPCVSAAHIYGKKRVACESFTNTRLDWDESPRLLKAQAVRHYAKGITHFITHTYTHNPQTDYPKPGTSFGGFVGTPFLRGQTWWDFMPAFTGWMAEREKFLERGYAAVDVLRYLGDDVGHKPDELEYFPEGYKCDYLNRDVLFNRLDVKDGRFVLPDGMSYSRIWIPDGTFLLKATESRLAALAAKGGAIIRGSADDSVRGLDPQLVAQPGDLLWYHRIEGEKDLYYIAAETNGFKGTVTFNTQGGAKRLHFDLGPTETKLLTFPQAAPPQTYGRTSSRPIKQFTLSFPPGWGAPDRLDLQELAAWKDLPGVSAEGRAFSGTATYTATINGLPASRTPPTASVILDLGAVRDCARVFVNGREAAALWAEPYRCDITPFVKEGDNELRIAVTSTWYNRLAYDFNQPPEKRKTWTIWNVKNRQPSCLSKDAELRDSGLLGPVSVIIHEK